MRPDQIDLARRLVACKGWRWMPGMLSATPPGAVWRELGADRLRVQSEWESGGPCGAPDGAVPDFSDPATLGCLLQLVREAWGDPRLVAIYCEPAHPGQSEGWAVQAADNRLPVAGEDYETEAAALVAALEAAP